jgi:hypothetical protein
VESLPVACTLTTSDASTRARRWEVLHDRARPSAELAPGRLEFRYPPAPGVHEELLELAAAERACCAFVAWEVVVRGDRPELRVTGEPEGVSAVAAMFGVENPAQSPR